MWPVAVVKGEFLLVLGISWVCDGGCGPLHVNNESGIASTLTSIVDQS